MRPPRRFLGSESKFAQPKAGPQGSVLRTEAKLASDPNNRLPPEGAAAPAVWRSQSRGPSLVRESFAVLSSHPFVLSLSKDAPRRSCCVNGRVPSQRAPSRSLGGRRGVGCKVSAAVYFSPLSCQISRYSAAKASKTILAGATFRFDAFCRPDS